MKILVAGLKKNSQLLRLQEEGKKRGHVVHGCLASELKTFASSEEFIPEITGKSLKSYDLIYLMVSKRRWEWYMAAYYLKKTKGTIIVNNKVIDSSFPMYLTPVSDYFRQREKRLPFPKSVVIYSSKYVEYIESKISYPMVIKPISGRQGRDVIKISSQKELLEGVDKILKNSIACVIREFIPNDGDIRVFTVGYKAVGAMKRIPKKGDFRSNISQGGTGIKYDLKDKEEVRRIAEKAAFVVQTEIAGVDIIIDKNTGKPYILEINPGPQFAGIEKFTSSNIALEIIKYFEKLYETTG